MSGHHQIKVDLVCNHCGNAQDGYFRVTNITCESKYKNPLKFICKNCGSPIYYNYTPNKCEVELRIKKSQLYHISKKHGLNVI